MYIKRKFSNIISQQRPREQYDDAKQALEWVSKLELIEYGKILRLVEMEAHK